MNQVPKAHEQHKIPPLETLATPEQEAYLAHLEALEKRPRESFVMGEIGRSAEDQAKRGWAVELDGTLYDEPIATMRIDLSDGTSVEYGKRPEGYDAPVIRSGIRAVTAPYILKSNGELLIGRVPKTHPHIIGEFASLPDGLPKPGGEATVLATGINNNSAFIDTSQGFDGLAIIGQKFESEEDAKDTYEDIEFVQPGEALDTPDMDVIQSVAFIIDGTNDPDKPRVTLEDLTNAYNRQKSIRTGRLAVSSGVPRVYINGELSDSRTVSMVQNRMGVSLNANRDGLSLAEQGGGGVVTGIYAHETYEGQNETYVITLSENRLAAGGLVRNVLRGFLDKTDADHLSAANRETREEIGETAENIEQQTTSLLAESVNPDYRIFQSQTEAHPNGGVSFYGLSLRGGDITVVTRPNGQRVLMFSDNVRKANEGLENSKKVELILGARGLTASEVLGVDGFTNAVAAKLLVRDYASRTGELKNNSSEE